MQSVRIQRVRELLKRQLGEIIGRDLPMSQTGMVTVTDVQLSNNLQSATVYVGVIGADAQVKQALRWLQTERKRLQREMAHAVVLKYTPQIKFALDQSISRGNRVLEIIEELERSNPPHDGASEDH